MAGPYPTHAEALGLVQAVLRRACDRDARGNFLAWGTCRSEAPEASLLGAWRPPAVEAITQSPPRARTRQKAAQVRPVASAGSVT